jgi:DNA-binding transcriptional ArsR family regulator
MITIHLTSDDLANIRFAYRPLMEIPLSYRVLINPAFQSPYRPWVEEVRRSLHGLDLPYLSALVPPEGYIPDFLTPTPVANRTDVEDDFAELLATPDHVMRMGILELIERHGDSDIRRYFLAHPREAVECLVEDLRLYWRRTLAHYWPRMTSVIEGDILYRARRIALDGPGALFDDIHPSVAQQPNCIQIQPVCAHAHNPIEFTLDGGGIQLVPLVFRGCGRMYQFAPDWQPMLAFGARGAGLWYQRLPNSDQSLEWALGAMRAQVLQALTTPATTGEVALRLYLTAGSVSLHLTRLAKAGLVEPRRSGKRVYYHLTQRGQHLLALFDTTD